MTHLTKIILLILVISPIVVSINCATASQQLCGAPGGQCAYFTYNNGTNNGTNKTCVAPASCPVTSNQKATVWSNASYNCVPCFGASKSVCQSSCTQYGYYYDDNAQVKSCTTCKAEYGGLCSACNSNGCTSCSGGTNLASNNQSCIDPVCSIAYCQTCVNGSCTVCDSEHVVFNGICVCSITNCEVCGSSICYKCQNGFNLDSNRQSCSLKCIDNCRTCNTTSVCISCSVGYQYDTESRKCVLNCASIDSNCIACSTTTICQGCNIGYTLSADGKKCNSPCSDSNCNTCAVSSTCTSCNSGYKLNSSSSTCEKDICTIINCIQCASSNQCTKCRQFHLLSNNKRSCSPNCSITNCRFCSSLTTCSSCNDGYQISNNACASICSIENCNLCASVQTCRSCNVGYVLAQNNQACDYDCGIYKCLKCNSTSTCQLCYPGFTLDSTYTRCLVTCQEGLFKNSTTNLCQACPTNCASCDSQGLCLKCKYLYYLNSSAFTCESCSKIANCFSCNSQDNCQICVSGYYFSNKECKQTSKSCGVPNCIVCSSATTCDVCDQKYELTNSGTTCQKIACSKGQYLVGSTCTCGSKSYAENGQCVSCSDYNCLSCSSSLCFECASGYYVDGASCVACGVGCQTCDKSSCSSCKTGFLKNGNNCVVSHSNHRTSSFSRKGNRINCAVGCKTCDLDVNSNVVCLQADTGYVLVAGSLFKCDSSCKTCADIQNNGVYSTCLSCPKGFNLLAGSCVKCTGSNALTCRTTDSAYALTCLPGYIAVQGVCQACASNCLKCGSAGAGSCDLGGCSFGFFQGKTYKQCIKCFNGCPVCGSDPNQCLECGDYKYLLNGLCSSCPTNCLKCSSSTACTTCNSGFLLAADSTCKSPNINGCTEYDSNLACTACDQSYTLTNGSCVLNITCNIDKSCTSCQYSYYLENSTCLSCPKISNCNSCDSTNKTACSDCATGYYLDTSKSCNVCPTGCQTCSSAQVCTSAKDGYYLILDSQGSSSGKVGKCGGLCETCLNDALICLTCQSGSRFTGSQCISKRNYKVKYVGYLKALGKNTETSSSYQVGFLVSILSNFLTEVSKALGFSSLALFTQNSNIVSLVYQSVAVSFQTNSDPVANDPTVALQNTQFSDMGLVALDVTSNSGSSSSVNLGLVLGVSIPLGVLLIIIIIILKVKSSKQDSDQKVEQSDKGLEYEAEAI